MSVFSWTSLAVTEDIGRQLVTTGGRMTPKQIEIAVDAVTTEEIKQLRNTNIGKYVPRIVVVII